MRIFKSDDGAELREEDVRALTRAYEYGFGKGAAFEAADRVLAALAPKTCGALLPCVHDSDNCRHPHPCVLSPGHHRFGQSGKPAGCGHDPACGCGLPVSNPIHSPGHMTAPECWRES